MRERARVVTVAAVAAAAFVVLVGPTPTPTTPVTDGLAVAAGQVVTDEGGHLAGGPGREYVAYGTAWNGTALTYGFVNHTADLTVAAQEDAVARALATWSSVTPLTFTQVPDCGLAFNAVDCTQPDIRIAFGTGDHGGGSADPDFDGPGGTAAHAYYPPPNGLSAAGDVHFDDAETWVVGGAGTDLESIALHELGHALGLAHAPLTDCPAQTSAARPIMCGVLYGIDRTLAPDDVAGIQSLYGAPDGACGGYVVTVDLGAGDLPTAGRDVIRGTAGDDVVLAGGGDDIVCGLGGDDVVDLGPGADRGIGGGGEDVVHGRDGNDLVEGGGGDDQLTGGDGTDELRGSTGLDRLDGGTGPDTLTAGPQRDTCDGRGGRDRATSCEVSRNVP